MSENSESPSSNNILFILSKIIKRSYTIIDCDTDLIFERKLVRTLPYEHTVMLGSHIRRYYLFLSGNCL